MNTLEKVEGFSSLMKDTSSGGVINVDKAAYKSYIVSKQIEQRKLAERKVQSEQIQSMQEEINSIKDDISEVKQMLLALINKGK